MRRLVGFYVIAAVSMGIEPSYADADLAAQTRALVLIADTANAICYSVQQSGQESAVVLSGDSTAKLDGAISQVVDLKVRGTGQLTNQEYRGVMRQELASTLKYSQDCKKAVFDSLVVKILPTITAQTGLPVTESIHLKPRTVERPSVGVDCKNTNEPIENLLCADADLAKWDGQMGDNYRQRMRALAPADQAVLRQQQRDWLRLRDKTCNIPRTGNYSLLELTPTKPCILQITQQRARELAN